MKRWFIYALRDPITWDVKYVGKSGKPLSRFAQHVAYSARKTHRHAKWLRSLSSRGLSPMLEIIDTGMGNGHGAAERAWISEYKRRGAQLTNTAPGGEGWFGPPPDEVRKKISATLKNQKQSPETRAKRAASMRGRVQSEETRRKCSLAQKGKPRNPVSIERMRITKTGQKQSPEHVAKRTEAIRGLKRGPETGAKIAATKIGKPRSEETKAKIAASLTGKSLSEETRAKLRISQQLRRQREKIT